MSALGPWHVEPEIDGYAAGCMTRVFAEAEPTGQRRQVASTFDQTRPHVQYPIDEAEANARRIAALPGLIAAIRAAGARREPRHRVSMLVNDWDRILSALDAAEGVQP